MTLHGKKTRLIIACGALSREIRMILATQPELPIDLVCLPATLHNRPEIIAHEVEAKIKKARPHYDEIFVAYAECGTGGSLDRVLHGYGVTRLPGPHCYATFAGQTLFAELSSKRPGCFYVTDFLVRQFETLVIQALGLDINPELRDLYFGNYESLIYLAQTDDNVLDQRARAAALKLGLAYERILTGMGELQSFVENAERGDLDGDQSRGLVAGYPGPGNCEVRTTEREEAARRTLRASYRPRRNARRPDRQRRVPRTMAPE